MSPADEPVESAEELYEHAPCGYFTMRPKGELVRVNETLLRWLGRPREQLIGLQFPALLPIGGKIYYETHLRPLLRMQGSLKEVALDLLRADGRPLPVLFNAVEKRDASGVALLVRATVFDVSDRRAYERELDLARRKAEAASQAKADFLSMVSHEIRTPIHAIMGVAALLDRTAPTAQQEKFLRILKSSATNLLTLVNDILDFSKLEAGKMTLDPQPFELQPLIEDLVRGLEPKAATKGVAMRMELADDVPETVIGDRVKLSQVLTNLVGNAVKFTLAGSVTVRVAVVERAAELVALRFAVVDTGIGIPRDRLDAVFEQFTQASPSVGSTFGGTGLGLSISRRLLELHGTRMEVESAPDVGSTFGFVIRYGLLQGELPPPPPRVTRTGALRGLRVLAAEDNPVNVLVLSEYLIDWGVELDVVGNGVLALEQVQQQRYDLVILDLNMPELDGYETATRIRALPGHETLPLLAVSASMRLGHEERLARAGFDGFVGKPFDPDTLFDKIRAHTGRTGP